MIIDGNDRFLLNGKNYSYAMYVNRAGLLQHLYYGKKLGEGDLPFLISQADSPDPEDINMDLATDIRVRQLWTRRLQVRYGYCKAKRRRCHEQVPILVAYRFGWGKTA